MYSILQSLRHTLQGVLMPTISFFYGIRIFIPTKDHNPPHFHVIYNEFSAQIEISSGKIIAGKLPPKARVLTEEWRIIHKDKLDENWNLMIKSQPLKPIKGLE